MKTLIPSTVYRNLLAGAALVAACLLLAGSTLATDRLVTTLADSRPGSLRATIAASSNNDSIFFQPGLSGAITLTGGELEIPINLNIILP